MKSKRCRGGEDSQQIKDMISVYSLYKYLIWLMNTAPVVSTAFMILFWCFVVIFGVCQCAPTFTFIGNFFNCMVNSIMNILLSLSFCVRQKKVSHTVLGRCWVNYKILFLGELILASFRLIRGVQPVWYYHKPFCIALFINLTNAYICQQSYCCCAKAENGETWVFWSVLKVWEQYN